MRTPACPSRREHFHRFMKDVHAQLRSVRDAAEPLGLVARTMAREMRVLCLDELFVTDIADAMLLAGLFEGLFAAGVTLVFTSNAPPRGTVSRRLAAAALPAGHCADRAACRSLNMDAGTDYRLRQLEQAPLYVDATPARCGAATAASATSNWPTTRASCGQHRGREPQHSVHRRNRRSHLVRFRRDLRRPTLAGGLHRDRARLPHRRGAQRATLRRDPGQPGAPLHRAGRRVLRPRRQARALRRRAARRVVRRGAAAFRIRANPQPACGDADARVPGAPHRP